MGCEVAKGNGTLGLLEAKVAAPLVKLPLKRLYYHADRGHIPSVRIGRRVLFSEAALAEFIANGGRGLAAARRRLGQRRRAARPHTASTRTRTPV